MSACCVADFGARSCPVGLNDDARAAVGAPPNPAMQYGTVLAFRCFCDNTIPASQLEFRCPLRSSFF